MRSEESQLKLNPDHHWADILRCAQDDNPEVALSPLKFGRAQHQPCDNAEIHLLAGIIELGLKNLRIIELFLECLNGSRTCLPAEKNLHGPVQRRLWIRGRFHAQQRSNVTARAAHFIACQSQ
jgi:hypothetical protein